MSVDGPWYKTLPNNKWTIDADFPPYYPNVTWRDPSKNPSDMYDAPYFGSLGRYKPPMISMSFETCVACSKSSAPNGKTGVGDVFACVRWAHHFAIENKRVKGWSRYVDSYMWNSKNNPKLAYRFSGIANGPSKTRKVFLEEYFR
jgi:hypothetical protein